MVLTDEQIEFLKKGYQSMVQSELARAFNGSFGTSVNVKQLKNILRRYGIKSGRNCKFTKGMKPWNLGKKGYMGANKASFRKGNIPSNIKPLYAERIDKDGYVEIKVPEQDPYTKLQTRYKRKHVWLWEQRHGQKVPKGMAVIFRDGNMENFAIDNLMLVSRAELLFLNQHGYKDMPEELKPSIEALAKLNMKIAEAKKAYK